MTMSLDKMADVYGIKSKTLYPYENFKDANSYNHKLGNLPMEDFRSSLTNRLPLTAEIDEFNIKKREKSGKN